VTVLFNRFLCAPSNQIKYSVLFSWTLTFTWKETLLYWWPFRV